MSNHMPDWGWTQSERDSHRNTKTRGLRRDIPATQKHVSLPADVMKQVREVQDSFMQKHGLELSFSAALASLIRQAPAWPTE